jgi:hypothetical protein
MANFYNKTETLLTIPLPRGEEIRVVKGTKENGTEYMDIRTWYEDDSGEMKPGKGIGKPDGGMWDAIARAILERNDPSTYGKVFSIKQNKYIEEEK